MTEHKDYRNFENNGQVPNKGRMQSLLQSRIDEGNLSIGKITEQNHEDTIEYGLNFLDLNWLTLNIESLFSPINSVFITCSKLIFVLVIVVYASK